MVALRKKAPDCTGEPVGVEEGGAGEFFDAHCPMHRGFNGHCTGGGGKFFNGGPVWERAK